MLSQSTADYSKTCSRQLNLLPSLGRKMSISFHSVDDGGSLDVADCVSGMSVCMLHSE